MPAPAQEETKEKLKIENIKIKDFVKKLMETLGPQLTIFFYVTTTVTPVLCVEEEKTKYGNKIK